MSGTNKMQYPAYIGEIFSRLSAAGEEAYLVGGSLRDALLGIPPHDFDIATSALPEKVLAIFAMHRVIPTGIRHGTVSVIIDGEPPVEITTFRIDGGYTDGRHPDGVVFTRTIAEDLSRRDFTVNAMAYHPDKGLVDLFGGRQDLRDGVIRAVGDPATRFSEDALRIMRAFRFAAQLGFSIDADTLAGARQMRDKLSLIARERIGTEWLRLLCAKAPEAVIGQMTAYGILPYVVGDFVPRQESLSLLSRLPSEDILRLGAFFYGAPREEIVERMKSLKYANRQITGAAAVARGAAMCVASERDATALIAAVGSYAPLAVRLSVLLGNSPAEAEDLVMRNKAPTVIADLAVGGRDMEALGFHGKEIGQVLAYLLAQVMDSPADNCKERLTAMAEAYAKGQGKT